MGEIIIPRPSRHQCLFPELEQMEPLASISAVSGVTLLRGPMYSVYAELRDWKLRMKKAGLNPSTPIPVQLKRPSATAPAAVRSVQDFRKDNVKTTLVSPPPGMQRLNPSPPPPPNLEMKRVGSSSFGKMDEKRGCPPRVGSGRTDEFLMSRNFASYQETTSRSKEETRGGRAANKGLFGKAFTGFRRSSAKSSN